MVATGWNARQAGRDSTKVAGCFESEGESSENPSFIWLILASAQPKWKLSGVVNWYPMGSESRRRGRFSFRGKFEVRWTNEHGQTQFALAQCLDLSESGVRLECSRPIPDECCVSLRAERINAAGVTLTASALPRYCSKQNGKYVIGFEFQQPVTLLAPV